MTTLREQAAIAAMQGMLAGGVGDWLTNKAKLAVVYADALVEDLARTAPKDESPLRCTAAERELIEAELDYMEEVTPRSANRIFQARKAVQAERRAAKDALPRAGGDQ